jgi:hypothetical protein
MLCSSPNAARCPGRDCNRYGSGRYAWPPYRRNCRYTRPDTPYPFTCCERPGISDRCKSSLAMHPRRQRVDDPPSAFRNLQGHRSRGSPYGLLNAGFLANPYLKARLELNCTPPSAKETRYARPLQTVNRKNDVAQSVWRQYNPERIPVEIKGGNLPMATASTELLWEIFRKQIDRPATGLI